MIRSRLLSPIRRSRSITLVDSPCRSNPSIGVRCDERRTSALTVCSLRRTGEQGDGVPDRVALLGPEGVASCLGGPGRRSGMSGGPADSNVRGAPTAEREGPGVLLRRDRDSGSAGRMSVLALINMYPPHHLGGYELSCWDVVQRWRRSGHRVSVLTTTMRVPGVEQDDDPEVYRSLEFYWDDHRLVSP